MLNRQHPENSTKNSYLKSLDGLRLFASVNIVLLHIYNQRPVSYLVSVQQNFFDYFIHAPTFNASIFFLLSGFIFTYKYSRIMDKFPVKKYLVKRFKKLYPLHFITTVFIAAVQILLNTEPPDICRLITSLFMHLSFLWSFYPLNTYKFNLPSWSLSCFLLCYLLFPLFFKLVSKIKKPQKALFLILICFIPGILWTFVYACFNFNNELFLFFHTFAPVRFFEFLTGMLLARLFTLNKENQENKKPCINTGIIIFSLVLILINTYLRYSSNEYIYWLSYHVFCLVPYSMLVYSLAEEKGFICDFFKISIIRKLGQVSFYTYIIHFPVIFLLMQLSFFKDFIFSPVKIVVFLIILYGGSLLFGNINKKRKQKR
jgi:peptidoglycan/LPS O-acetylase OafA/YrhL